MVREDLPLQGWGGPGWRLGERIKQVDPVGI